MCALKAQARPNKDQKACTSPPGATNTREMACVAAKPSKSAEATGTQDSTGRRPAGERQRPVTVDMSLAQAVAALVGTCARRLLRAARRLHLRPPRQGLAAPAPSSSSRAVVPFLGSGGGGVIKKVLSSSSKSKRRRRKAEDDELSFEWDEEDGVWRKEIIMGERCQPLEFSGAIYYDAEGRRLEQPPTPRSPLRSPLPASVLLAANAGGR